MGYIKKVKTGQKFMDDDRPWVRIVRGILITLAMIALLGFMIHTTNQQPEIKTKYDIKVSNWVGSRWYSCDSYKQEGDTYKLYNSKGVLINEIKLSEGYLIEIQLND